MVMGDDRAPTPQQDDQTLPQTQSSPHEMASREQEDVAGAAEAALMPKRLVAQTNGLQAWIEEEARKLDRVECELQKQVLENKRLGQRALSHDLVIGLQLHRNFRTEYEITTACE